MVELRSVILGGVVAAALFAASTDGVAYAGSGGVFPPLSNGPIFITTAVVSTPPYDVKCDPTASGTVKFTTTLINPDGVHFTAKATSHIDAATHEVTLDFSKHTTQEWSSTYTLPDVYMVHNIPIRIHVVGYDHVDQQTTPPPVMNIACGVPNPQVPKPKEPTPDPVTPACTGYLPKTLLLSTKGATWELSKPNPFAQSLYIGRLEIDVLLMRGIHQHFENVCKVGSAPDPITVWNTEVASSEPIPWVGSCETYDGPHDMKIVNDATGWLVKSGTHIIGRYGLEADALAVGEVAKKRTKDCHFGQSTEPVEYRVHYLH